VWVANAFRADDLRTVSTVIDALIQGGTVVDGTGRAGRRADVGIDGGRVVAIGSVTEPAARVIDADGLVVAPGFVDLHTHYDAQLFWDPSASPSPLHGVTTVFGGNCGFSLAPTAPEHAGYLTRMMARVEGMPLSALEAGLDWSWESFGEWLARLDGKVGVNAGFLVGHSTLRRLVMGDDATGSEADEDQLVRLEDALHQALSQGAMGFSTSRASTHNDGDGQPVPSRAATDQELERLAAVVAAHPGTTIEMIVPGCLNGFSEDEVALMVRMSLLAQRPINWNVLGVSAANPDGTVHQLAASTTADRAGARIVALTLPHTMSLRLSFEHGAILDGLPGWRQFFASSIDRRIADLSDPAIRRDMDARAQSDEAGVLRFLANWGQLVIDEGFTEETQALEGRRVSSVARQRGISSWDALCQVVVADRLQTGFAVPIPESDDDWRARSEVWRDPRAVVGGSDAGAHLDTMCGAVYSTSLLGDAVRRRQLLSLEEAVRLLTEVPARLYGLVDRGRVAEGFWADLVVFDPAAVDHDALQTRRDLPGGAARLYAGATGIEHVLVNGIEVVSDGRLTGATPGRVLRSGADTLTVGVPGEPPS
jgi:N-acyl-D-aspartate/D-glutamate deacylase